MTDILNSVLVARHPIFDENLHVYAYELLFRRTKTAQESGVNSSNGDLATAQVINHTFMELGIDRVVGEKIAFINLTRTFLTGEMPIPFDNSQVVLEVLENIEIDDDIINAVTELTEKGYRIALDDFIFQEQLRPVIKLCNIIKIDIQALSEKELIEHVELLKNENIDLLAEKVETAAEYQLCRQLGFKYFQGFFFSRPTVVSDKPIPHNQLALLRTLAELQNIDLTLDTLEELISHDVSLSYKLLRFINSAAIALPRKIESLREAIVFLGLATIKKWATLLAYSSLDSQITELLTLSLVRAKMCESLANVYFCDPKSAFLIGLFSALDAILSKPMTEIVKSLPVGDDINDALINKSGNLGKLLDFIISYEQDYSVSLPESLPAEKVNTAYLDATQWVIQIQNTL